MLPAIDLRAALVSAKNNGRSHIAIQDVLGNVTRVIVESVTEDAICCLSEGGAVRLIGFHAIVWIEFVT